MTDHHEPARRLERLIDEVLRKQPPLRAPSGLQMRVWAQIERGARSWWRRPFMHWPASARAVFLLAAAGFAWLAAQLTTWLTVGASSRLAASFEAEFTWIRSAQHAAMELNDFHSMLTQGIVSSSAAITLVFIAALYVALFGLGAAAYRMLYNPVEDSESGMTS